MSKVWLLLILLGVRAGWAQESLSANAAPTGAGAVLLDMASRAQIIFCGQVLAVARHDDLGFVEITFQVETPVKGVATPSFVLREWAGRWIAHPDRYSVGRRLLMLLPSAGPSGLSAPIDGGDGALPILPGAAAAGPETKDTLLTAPDAVVDLRLLAARVERTVTPLPVAGPERPVTGVNADVWVGAVAPLEQTNALVLNPALPIVLHLLRGGL